MPKPEIIVHDPATVTIDGEHAGSITDVLANHGKVAGIHGAVLDALRGHIDTIHAAHQADKKAIRENHAAEVAAHKQAVEDQHRAHADELARLRADHQAAHEQLTTAQAAKIKTLEESGQRRDAMLAALGGAAAYRETCGYRLELARAHHARAAEKVAELEAEAGEAGAVDA